MDMKLANEKVDDAIWCSPALGIEEVDGLYAAPVIDQSWLMTSSHNEML